MSSHTQSGVGLNGFHTAIRSREESGQCGIGPILGATGVAAASPGIAVPAVVMGATNAAEPRTATRASLFTRELDPRRARERQPVRDRDRIYAVQPLPATPPVADDHSALVRTQPSGFRWELEFGIWDVFGTGTGLCERGNAENVEFGGIAA
jgi:hypothetical protein